MGRHKAPFFCILQQSRIKYLIVAARTREREYIGFLSSFTRRRKDMKKKETTISQALERDLLDDIGYYELKLRHARPDTANGYESMKREKIKELI